MDAHEAGQGPLVPEFLSFDAHMHDAVFQESTLFKDIIS